MMYFISGFQVFFRACFPSPSNCSIGEPKRAGVTFCFHEVLLKPYTVPHTLVSFGSSSKLLFF